MGKIGFLFSGQGAQYPGMMRELYEQVPECRTVFDTADDVLGRKISELSFEGEQEALNYTHNTQPCVLAADLTAFAALAECGITADAVAGFSLGEYAALVAAGVMSTEDAFRVIQFRADAMQGAVPLGQGAMAAVSGTEEQVEGFCKEVSGYVIPANYNCPKQIVVSGEKDAVQAVVDEAWENGCKAMLLPVSAPFHCELMNPVVPVLREMFEKMEFADAGCPIYMNYDANPEQKAVKIAEKVLLQTVSSVRWEKTIRNMYDAGIRIFIELGPGKTLSGFVKKTLKDMDDIEILRVFDMSSLQETVTKVRRGVS